MYPDVSSGGFRHRYRGFAVVVAVCLAVYWRSAYPTITWWDSSSYSLAAVTLGITHPPGSLLLTILGWLATRLPLGLPPALVLNLLAGILAALATGLVYLVTLRLIRLTGSRDRPPTDRPDPVAVVGAALGALTFAFGVTLWQYAVMFTPYVLTVVFTGLILVAMLRWWEDAERGDAWRWLLVLGLLFGLDVSVHRTNLLLLPGLLVWIVLRHPRTLGSVKAWLSGVGGVLAGLAVHLLIMPIAASDPTLNFGDPSTWSRFYEYVSLNQYGGGFLVQFVPRRAPFWSVQVTDLVRALVANFFGVTGPLGVLGLLPGILGLTGIDLLWQRHRRLGSALVAVMVVHAAMTVLYFNIPANYFRPLTRHYLPVFVPFATAIAYGLYGTLRRIVELSWGRERHALAWSAMLLVLAPASQLTRNWTHVDASGRFFAEDYATNVLHGLPENTILFTSGDNDTWPLLYVQAAQGLRPDVQVVNLSLTNSIWFVEQLVRRDPTFPLSLSAEQRHALASRHWTDTVLAIPVTGTAEHLGLARGAEVPAAIHLRAAPTVGDRAVLRQDLILLQVLEDNRWRRPLALSLGLAPGGYTWLAPFRRVDGLFARVVPTEDPPADIQTLRANLLQTYEYRGYADSAVRLDDVTRLMGQHYYVGFMELARAEYDPGDPERCYGTGEAMIRLLPPARLEPGMSMDFCRRPRRDGGQGGQGERANDGEADR